MNGQLDYFEKYAGFWKRFVALVIDEIILGFVRSILLIPVFLISSFSLFPFFEDNYQENFVFTNLQFDLDESGVAVGAMVFVMIILVFLISTITGWLYYALMESSQKQATFGKIVLSIKVTDLEMNKISFGKASLRYFTKILSALFFYIGYIMAGFTEKKQALHDLISGCLVVNKSSEIYNELNIKEDSFGI